MKKNFKTDTINGAEKKELAFNVHQEQNNSSNSDNRTEIYINTFPVKPPIPLTPRTSSKLYRALKFMFYDAFGLYAWSTEKGLYRFVYYAYPTKGTYQGFVIDPENGDSVENDDLYGIIELHRISTSFYAGTCDSLFEQVAHRYNVEINGFYPNKAKPIYLGGGKC